MESYEDTQKINRHVFQAISHYMNQENGSKFMQIFQYVKKCIGDSKTPANLRNILRSSLEGFQRAGVIYKDASNLYKIRCPILLGEMIKMASLETNEGEKSILHKASRNNVPSTSRKRKISRDSFDSDDNRGVIKRFTVKKKTICNRKGKKLELPRARKYRDRPGSIARISAEETGPKSMVPHDMRQVEVRRKTQKSVNFDNCSIGEPGADDRDSGDEFRVHSMTSLFKADENDQIARKDKSTSHVDQDAPHGNFPNHNIESEASKISLLSYT